MIIADSLNFKNFVVLGNTKNEEKYASKIYKLLKQKNYNVVGVPNEVSSINEVPFEIECLVLCINPTLGLIHLKENSKRIKFVIIQPGAESNEIHKFLDYMKIEYKNGCIYKELMR